VIHQDYLELAVSLLNTLPPSDEPCPESMFKIPPSPKLSNKHISKLIKNAE